jgi:hypothetical protein
VQPGRAGLQPAAGCTCAGPFRLHARMPVLPWELQCVLYCINGARVPCQPSAKPPRRCSMPSMRRGRRCAF